MRIREAVIGDAEAIAAVHVLSWQAAYKGIMPEPFLNDLSVVARAKTWHAALEARRIRVLLAYVDNAIAGWIACGACRDADKDGQWGEVEALYVLPSFWGRGVGKRLSDAARQLLHDAGYAHVALWVLSGNHRAIAFYNRIGFVPDHASKDIRIGDAPLTEIRYYRSLTN